MMFIVGLTGGLATGKSTVLSIFREKGIAVIDADEVARKGSCFINIEVRYTFVIIFISYAIYLLPTGGIF